MTMKEPARVDGLFQTELNEQQKLNSKLNLNEFHRGAAELASFPRRVVLELTNMCNYRCIMCGRNYSHFKPSYLDVSAIDTLDEVLRHTEEVTLFGWGEPTAHPEFSVFMDRLHTYSKLRKYMLTNGSNLDFVSKLVKNNMLDILAISVDGATPETHNSIRCGSDFEYITSKIKEIAGLKNEGIQIPYINLVFVIMKRNMHELPRMVQLTHDLGIPELKAVYLTSFNHDLDSDVIWNCQDQFSPIYGRAVKLAKELDVKIKFPPLIGADSAADLPHRECSVAWRDLFIGSDGSIRPCQSSSTVLGHLSDVAQGGFWHLWNSKKFRTFRQTVNCNRATMDQYCRKCYQSSHANWNNRFAHLQIETDSIPEWNTIQYVVPSLATDHQNLLARKQ